MDRLTTYDGLGLTSADEVFGYLIRTLTPAIRAADFFVDWNKAISNTETHITPLGLLNSLLGSPEIRRDFAALLKSSPSVIPIVPLLVAVRLNGSPLDLMDNGEPASISFRERDLDDRELEQVVDFADKAGLLQFLANSSVTNLVDYYLGVEVGLDSNGRKNRGGDLMESMVYDHLVTELGIPTDDIVPQATAATILDRFGIAVPMTEAGHRFDFAVRTRDGIALIETNYYSGGGSKLYAIAGQYQALNRQFSERADIHFVWITDGIGWVATRKPLRDTFDSIPHLFNIQLLQDGALGEVLSVGSSR